MKNARHVHVIGTGTIGEPLIGLLADFRKELGIDTVSFHKRTPLTTERAKVRNLMDRGALLCTDAPTIPKFEDQGLKVSWDSEEAIGQASVVIDCTPSGVGHENKKKYYDRFTENTFGFLAQGSEFGFGKMYARGINDEALSADDKFVQVVSCNTHNISVLLKTLALPNDDPSNLVEAKFVMMRRASDTSQDGDYIPAPQVGKHSDPRFGTHHARDAYHLFQTLGYELNLFSSAIKLNTQYMHCLWFNLQLKEKITLPETIKRLKDNRRIATTEKTSANQIFSFGRDHGHYGRILSQTVVPISTLQVVNDHEIVGFAFTPQDGNPLLSTVAVSCWYLDGGDMEKVNERVQCLRPFLFQEI